MRDTRIEDAAGPWMTGSEAVREHEWTYLSDFYLVGLCSILHGPKHNTQGEHPEGGGFVSLKWVRFRVIEVVGSVPTHESNVQWLDTAREASRKTSRRAENNRKAQKQNEGVIKNMMTLQWMSL